MEAAPGTASTAIAEIAAGGRLPVVEGGSGDDSGRPEPKEVRYWAAEVVGGAGTLVNEIDEIAWLDVDAAADRLSYSRDGEQLRALMQADRSGNLTTWPLVIVRHAHAYSRSTWSEPDPLRPLDDRGRERADALVPILSSYGVTRVVTSPSVRCLASVLPYAVAAQLKVRLKPGLSEEGFAEQPDHARRHLARLLDRGTATVVSSHGPVLPTLLEHLAGIADPDESGGSRDSGGPREAGEHPARLALLDAAQRGMGKGEALVAHLVETGTRARVVEVEVYPS